MALNEKIIRDIYLIRQILEMFEKSDFDSEPFSYLWGFWKKFPAGCCGEASEIIGLFLLKVYHLESTYIIGKGFGVHPEQYHAWLKCGEYIIDITADQFNDLGYDLPKVIIKKHSLFHKYFHKINEGVIVENSEILMILNKVLTRLDK